jgi:hypothetical protein
MSILVSRHPRLRSFLYTAFALCFGVIGPQLALAGDGGRFVAGTIQDYTPDDMEIDITRVGSTAQETIKPGASVGRDTSLYIGDTLSISKWCQKHKDHLSSVTVIIGSEEVHLNCNKNQYYTFTRQMPSSEPSSTTAPTITSENPGTTPTIAVSPSRMRDESTTAPSPSQSPKIEDLLRKGGAPPSAK